MQGYEVEREPNIHWGRADLGVYKKGTQNLYIEVGTTSLFKLLVNLTAMRNITYLIVPSDDKLIEFRRDWSKTISMPKQRINNFTP